LNSSINGLIINDNLSSIITLFVILLSFRIYFTEISILEKRYLSSFLILFLGWLLLYYFDRLPVDSTRHMLFFAPMLSILFYVVLKNFKSDNKFLILTLIVFSTISFFENINILNSKKSVFDFKKVDESNIEFVYTYSSTLAPLIAFENKKVFNLDFNSFKNVVKILPNRAFLLSQNENLNQYLAGIPDITDYRRKFLSNYSIKTIEEINTGIFFPFNNNSVSSNQNGFYLYELNRKNEKL